MIKKFRLENHRYIRCFLIALITAVLSFIYFIIRNKGFFTVCDDFDTQQLTFGAAVRNALYNGHGGQWVWNLDLGSSLISGFSFYNLGSPFYWISLLFPKVSFPYLAGWLYILKYVIATMNAYLYLNCFIHEDNNTISDKLSWKKVKPDAALIGALLYAFSGFQAVNLEFFHFHDVVAMFPLLLWGIENVDDRKKRPLFILAVAVNCLTNYFFFVQSVIFMLIYFIIRFWGTNAKEMLRKMGYCFLCGFIGVGIAAIIFIPSAIYISGNSRSSSAVYLSNFVFSSRNILFILKGILFPGDSMRDESVLISREWNSTSCYIPLFGLSFVFAYMKAEKNWLRNLLVVLTIILFCPILNSGFLLFTEVYQRWYYTLVLMLSLATAEVVANPDEYDIRWGIIVYLLLCIGFYLAISFIPYDASGESIVYHPRRFACLFAVAVFGPMFIAMLRRMKLFNQRMILSLTMIFSVATTALNLHIYRSGRDYHSVQTSYQIAEHLGPINDQYRYASMDNVMMLAGNAAGYGAFSSTIENSSHKFQQLLDLDLSNNTLNRDSIPGIRQLLAGRYSYTWDENADNIIDSVADGTNTLYITDGIACPIGYAVHKYIYEDELKALPQEERGIALLNAAVITPEEVTELQGGISHIDVNSIDFNESPDDLSLKNDSEKVFDFSRDNHGFTCTTDYSQDSVVYFSVPYDNGWTAYVDGKKCDIIDSGGMMLINVPEGKHSISFTYVTPGFKAGVLVSAASLCIFLVYCITGQKKKYLLLDK